MSNGKSIYSTRSYSVAIVGAGLSGIVAAHELVQRGFTVTILEARDRIGGRIHTEYLPDGSAIELGCHFLHGPGGNPLTPSLKKFQIDMAALHPEKMAIYDLEGKLTDIESETPFTDLIQKKLNTLHKKRYSAVSEFQKAPKSIHHEFLNLLYTEAQYTPNKLQNDSLMAYKLGQTADFVGGNYLILNGYEKLPSALVKEAENTGLLEIKLNHVVRRITDKGRKVVITTEGHGTVEADIVICTVPLKILNNIVFEPPLLTNKTEAIERLGVAIHDKTILQFENAFWPENVDYLVPFDVEAGIWREIINLYHFHPDKAPTLVISNHADLMNLKKSDEEIIQGVLSMMRKIFGNKLSAIQKSWVTHWYSDPYALGSYSYHTEGSSLEDNRTLAKPIGRTCFAGEHTSDFPSSVHGAYLSGIQAAQDVSTQLHLF